MTRDGDLHNRCSDHCARDCLHSEVARAVEGHIEGVRDGAVIRIDWDPIGHLGPIPINRYGLGWAAAFLVGWYLVRRWASASVRCRPDTIRAQQAQFRRISNADRRLLQRGSAWRAGRLAKAKIATTHRGNRGVAGDLFKARPVRTGCIPARRERNLPSDDSRRHCSTVEGTCDVGTRQATAR